MNLLTDYFATQNKTSINKILIFILLILLLGNIGYFQLKQEKVTIPMSSASQGLKAKKILDTLYKLDQILPLNMRLNSLTLTPDEIMISGISYSEKSISYFAKQFAAISGLKLNENLNQAVAEGVSFKMSFYEKN